MAFRLEAFQNRFLAPGQTRVDAILSVSVDADAAGATAAERDQLVGFILDKSGSMTGDRMNAAKGAVVQAIHVLRPSTWFFVVAFDATSQVVVSPVRASGEHKRDAEGAIDAIGTGGGTAMSTGLHAARALMARMPNAIRQCVFLTDGKNESEKPHEVADALRSCSGVFQCDCWGVGTDWRVGEVQSIARALLGKASIIPEPAGIEAAFRDAMNAANGKSLKDARLRLWTPQTAHVALVQQVNPTIEDIAPRGREVSPQVHDYMTGTWGPGETRDFHVAIDVKAGGAGDEMLACRPSIVYLAPDAAAADGWIEREDKVAEARVFATWTEDGALSSRIDHHVAHYAGQDDLAKAIASGLELREQGNEAGATQMLGRAVQLAHASGNAEMTQRLARVVDVVDASAGTVRLRRTVKKEAAMDLELESRTTKRARKTPGPTPGAGGTDP
jgi:hypothetical protein